MNILALALPCGKTVEEPTWVLIEEYFESGYARIRTGKEDESISMVPRGQLVPFMEVDSSCKNPEEPFQKDFPRVIMKLLLKKTENRPSVEIKQNTLVIVKAREEHPPEDCWGLVAKKHLHGRFDVRIGATKKILLPADQIVPVAQTKGSLMGPMSAFKAAFPRIAARILLCSLEEEAKSRLDFLRRSLK